MGGTAEKMWYKERDQERASTLVRALPAIELIKHPSRTLVIGKSQSGKTTLGVQIIEYLLPFIDELVVCSPTYDRQDTWDPIRHRVSKATDLLDATLRYVKNKGADEKTRPRMLLVIDDMSYERRLNEGNKGILNGLFYNAKWLNLSILVMCHKISNVGSGLKENLENLVLFQTINNTEVAKLGELYSVNGSKKDFITMYYNFVTRKILTREDLHPFLFINYSSGTRVIANMTDEIPLTSIDGISAH